MIVIFQPPASGTMSLDLRSQFGPRVELEMFNFIETPEEFRLCRDGKPICGWRPGDRELHDLQRTHLPVWRERNTGFEYSDPPQETDHVTFGLSPVGLTLETNGLIGTPRMIVNLRPGTFPESSCSGGD